MPRGTYNLVARFGASIRSGGKKTSVESAEPAKGGDAHTELRTGAVAALEAADVPFLLDDGLEAP